MDSFLFLLHRISCYLLRFRINSVAVGLQFSFADWAHWAGANADVTAWKWVFRALKRTHFVINIIKLKLIRKLFRRFLISGTLVRHRNERPSASVREILRYQQPDRERKVKKAMPSRDGECENQPWKLLDIIFSSDSIHAVVFLHVIIPLLFFFAYFIKLCCPLRYAEHQISRMNLNFGPRFVSRFFCCCFFKYLIRVCFDSIVRSFVHSEMQNGFESVHK